MSPALASGGELRAGERVPALGWLELCRSLADAPRLARENPLRTGYMRHRAAESGRAQEAGAAWVPLNEVSPYLVGAVLWAEDRVFFSHRGFWWRQMRAEIVAARRQKRGVRGVSTITQQLARNLYLCPGRTMRRKLQEAILAWRLERVLSKERILELYLNRIEWGEGIWGVGLAARTYFGLCPAELGPVPSIVLASMIPAPRRPLQGANAERAVASQQRLPLLLYKCGLLSHEEGRAVSEALAEVAEAIRAGAPAAEVFRRARERAVEPTLRDRPEVSTRELVAAGGGFERLKSFNQMLRESGSPKGQFPLWWRGSAARAPRHG